MKDFRAPYLCGIFTMYFVALVFWHTGESDCQETHDVYDCEWSQSPFTPKLIEARTEGTTP
jgi:hypothetical protein